MRHHCLNWEYIHTDTAIKSITIKVIINNCCNNIFGKIRLLSTLYKAMILHERYSSN